MAQIPYLRIFVSSPSDVAHERHIANEVIKRLPDRPAFREKISFRIISWDDPGTNAPMYGSMSPQEAINRQLPLPADCDIVVVLFWSRMGTPFTDKDGKEYLSGTHWELMNALSSETTNTLIYRNTSNVTVSIEDSESRDQYLQLKSFFESETFFKNGKIIRGVNEYQSPDDFRLRFENHLEEIVLRYLDGSGKEILHQDTDSKASDNVFVTTVSTNTWEGSPFPGLRAFTPDDAPIFFGRGKEIDELLDKVRLNRFVSVVGASGSGKSSLVGAGLVPRLQANAISTRDTGSKDWFIVRFKPGSDPFSNFAEELVNTIPALKIEDPYEYSSKMTQLIKDLKDDTENYLKHLVKFSFRNQKPWTKLLVIVDQFEELYTLSESKLADSFISLLKCESDLIRVVITLRADFYHKALIPLETQLRDGTFTLGPPTSIALHEMITRPIELANINIETDLPERIVKDTGDDPGALALMAYALDELYLLVHQRGNNTISSADYEQLGKVQGAIGKRAQNIFQQIDGEIDYKNDLLKRIFYKLVEVDHRGIASKRPVALAEIVTDEQTETLVNLLTEARLLIQFSNSSKGHQPYLEVAHEALFSNWPALKSIIDDIQEDLIILRQVENAALDWQRRNKNADFFWSHERLVYVYTMLDRMDIEFSDLPDIVQEFIRPEQDRLLDELNLPETSHIRRMAIGHRLSNIGDPRPGVGLSQIGIPDIVWLKAPSGKVTIENHTFEVENLYVAKYPVTHIQFEAFINDGGYETDEWWKGLYSRSTSPKDQITRYDNCPRDSVRWVDAMAFSNWLNSKFSSHPELLPPGVRIDDEMQIRLPTEWEWQQAATGGNPQNKYPWGPEWGDLLANTMEAQLSITNSVGMHPLGASPLGALDMSGNICEWCLNGSEDIHNIDISKDFHRVRRGGSCNHDKSVGSTTYRFGYDPRFRFNHDLGFRVFLGPKLY